MRTVLRVDAAACGVLGLVLLLGADWLSTPLGLPAHWSVPFGVFLLGAAVALALIAGYRTIPRGLAWAVIALNAVCALEMLLLPLTGWVPLTGLGTAVLVTGALAVAVFADVEYLALRRMR
ncbi:hypothetical protein HPT28_10730 [Streptomyces sp. JJ38]|nr:hypothetical protein [Streptomyces sp. JJ38]